MNNNYSSAVISMVFTVLLGVYFLYIQYEEYCESSFCLSDGVYGTTFFVSTGFHGIHVIVGTTILAFTLANLYFAIFTYNHHFIFEASA